MIGVRGSPGSALPLGELVRVVHEEPERFPAGMNTELKVTRVFDGGEGGWSGGTHVVEVDVDVETGLVRIDRYVVVEDCGVPVNPAIVEGQIRGGVTQAIGAVLLEHSVYDEDGQFLSSTFMDYLLPTTTEVPNFEIYHVDTVPLDADVNFRGVGEGGMIIAPAAITNAIEDALRHLGCVSASSICHRRGYSSSSGRSPPSSLFGVLKGSTSTGPPTIDTPSNPSNGSASPSRCR